MGAESRQWHEAGASITFPHFPDVVVVGLGLLLISAESCGPGHEGRNRASSLGARFSLQKGVGTSGEASYVFKFHNKIHNLWLLYGECIL